MKKFLIFFATALFATAVPAFATTIPQTVNFGGVPNFSQNLTFNQFDTTLGTLNSIKITLNVQATGGHIVIDNDSDSNALGTFEFGAKASLSSTDVVLLDSSLHAIPGQAQVYSFLSINLAGNTADGPNDFSPLPPDGNAFDGGTVSDTKSGYVGISYWDAYQGTGTYDIYVNSSQWLNYIGSGGIEYSVNPVTTTGNVEVIYDYDPIPEPATIALLYIGTFALRKRKNSKFIRT